MVATLRTPKPTRIALPSDGPLMQLCRVPDAMRLMLGGASEDGDQRRLKNMLDAMGLLWMHTANEGKRGASERGSALARGLKKGVPDALIIRPFNFGGVTYNGLAIELKTSAATPCKVEDDQRRWLTELRAAGWMAEWCRGFGEAAALVRRAYGGG